MSTKRLINSSIVCTIDRNGKIIIPIDDLHFRGKMDINVEVTIHESSQTKVLTLPYPLWIRVNPSILDCAEVSDESRGTVPELLEEARAIIDGDHYILTEDDKQEIAGMVNITGKENIANKKTSISNQSQTGDGNIYYPTVGAVRNYIENEVSELEDYVDDEFNTMDGLKADKATTLAGYGITNAYTKAEVNGMIPTVPTKVSDLSNDSGFLTLSTLPKYNGGVQ